MSTKKDVEALSALWNADATNPPDQSLIEKIEKLTGKEAVDTHEPWHVVVVGPEIEVSAGLLLCPISLQPIGSSSELECVAASLSDFANSSKDLFVATGITFNIEADGRSYRMAKVLKPSDPQVQDSPLKVSLKDIFIKHTDIGEDAEGDQEEETYVHKALQDPPVYLSDGFTNRLDALRIEKPEVEIDDVCIPPTIDVVWKIAEKFGVDPGSLAYGVALNRKLKYPPENPVINIKKACKLLGKDFMAAWKMIMGLPVAPPERYDLDITKIEQFAGYLGIDIHLLAFGTIPDECNRTVKRAFLIGCQKPLDGFDDIEIHYKAPIKPPAKAVVLKYKNP